MITSARTTARRSTSKIRRISFRVNGIKSPGVGAQSRSAPGDHRQECHREHAQRSTDATSVKVPTWCMSSEDGLTLDGLERLLDRPSLPDDADQLTQRPARFGSTGSSRAHRWNRCRASRSTHELGRCRAAQVTGPVNSPASGHRQGSPQERSDRGHRDRIRRARCWPLPTSCWHRRRTTCGRTKCAAPSGPTGC